MEGFRHLILPDLDTVHVHVEKGTIGRQGNGALLFH